LDTNACSDTRKQLNNCLRSFDIRNNSCSLLQTAYDDLAEDWENTTAVLDQSLASTKRLEKAVETSNALLNSTKMELANVKESCEREAEAGRQKISSLQSIVDNVQEDLQCLKDSPNCTYESEKYFCLLRVFLPSLCLRQSQTGQELFRLSNCNSLTDDYLLQIDWALFAKENPYLTILLIFLIIFAVIGFLSVFSVSVWCVAEVRRRRRRVWVPTVPKQSEPEPSAGMELTSVSKIQIF